MCLTRCTVAGRAAAAGAAGAGARRGHGRHAHARARRPRTRRGGVRVSLCNSGSTPLSRQVLCSLGLPRVVAAPMLACLRVAGDVLRFLSFTSLQTCCSCLSPCLQGGRTPLHVAAESGSIGVAEALLAAGANIEAQVPPACKSRSTHLFALFFCRLASAVARPAQDDEGLTPLMHAARRGHDDCVKLLLKRGAQVINYHSC